MQVHNMFLKESATVYRCTYDIHFAFHYRLILVNSNPAMLLLFTSNLRTCIWVSFSHNI